MDNKIEIPKWLQFRIYFSLILTTLLFISVYVVLFYIGGWISINWWETPELYNSFGIGLVIIGLIPLIYALSVKSGEEGFEAKEKDFPELFKCVREIAKEFNIKMPSKILILPTEEIFVTGVFNKKIGVGIAGLRAISNEELKAILRHEFGHFYGNDTVIGSMLSRIQLSLESSSKFGKSWWDAIPLMEIAIIGLIIAGFSKAYSFIFRVIISIYSRQVEYRADYVASIKSGKETFGNALLNYSAYTTYFGQVGYNSVVQLLQEGKAFMNIYDSVYQAYEKEDAKNLKKVVFESDKGSIFSSHPKLRKRLKEINLNSDSLKVSNKIKNSAISLISKRKQVEEELTQVITNNLHVNLLYADAVSREGKCRYCGEQFEQLQDLLEHEEHCESKE
jgi:Zn-dependent protease with chaperone function